MTTATQTLQKKSMSAPDELRTFAKGKVEVVNFGGLVAGRALLGCISVAAFLTCPWCRSFSRQSCEC